MPNLSSSSPNPERLVRPILRKLEGYVPGEQPKIPGLVKLNTNENPYPPSPKVLAALRGALDGRLRLYPNPTAEGLRRKLAKFHRCSPDNIIVGNGSDELLALATRAFVEPLTGLTHYALESAAATGPAGQHKRRAAFLPRGIGREIWSSRYTVQYFQPSYSLYPVLAAIHGARPKAIPLGENFELPNLRELKGARWDSNAALTLITTPNAPSGRGYPRAQLEALCRGHSGLIILDEAYVDYAQESALELALEYPHVLAARTFSKGYSLCFLRVGYMVGHPKLIAALHKIRDSYNVNGLGQIAAEAALDSLPYYRTNFRRIIRSREFLSNELAKLGFTVFPSQTNFILVKPPIHSAEGWQQHLRERKVLVRWFSAAEVRDCLRITVGSEEEVGLLLTAARTILKRS